MRRGESSAASLTSAGQPAPPPPNITGFSQVLRPRQTLAPCRKTFSGARVAFRNIPARVSCLLRGNTPSARGFIPRRREQPTILGPHRLSRGTKRYEAAVDSIMGFPRSCAVIQSCFWLDTPATRDGQLYRGASCDRQASPKRTGGGIRKVSGGPIPLNSRRQSGDAADAGNFFKARPS
jgi:hypothetical protein